MKNFFGILTLLAIVQVHAVPTEVVRVLKDETTMVALELSEANVFCTDLGYGNVQLKVNVPELDQLAHFDHRVVGEGLPCITGGECREGNGTSDILSGERLVAVPMRVTLGEVLTIDREAGTCTRSMVEIVKSHIKGKDFDHYRYGAIENQNIAKCLKVANL